MAKKRLDDPELKAKVGKRLLAYREVEGIDANDLCSDFSFGASAWSNWEVGERMPTVYLMIEVANATGLTLDYIYRGRFEGMASEMSRALRGKLNETRVGSAEVLMHPASPGARTKPKRDGLETERSEK